MLLAIKPHNTDGFTRPRAVAHALQMARLLQSQKDQTLGAAGFDATHTVVPSATLMGSLLYFMVLRIEHCQQSHACDPSRSALFYWFDDTFRQVEQVKLGSLASQKALQDERGDIVKFLLHQENSFAELSAALQMVNPYDFAITNIPKGDHMVNQHLLLSSRAEYSSMIHYILQQYVTDGAGLLHAYADHHQVMDMKFLLRAMVHMRALARGVGKAALLHEDYLLAAESYSFSGDFFHAEMQEKFLHFVAQTQNTLPDTCERILSLLDQSKLDWFSSLKQIYQDASSSRQFVATNS